MRFYETTKDHAEEQADGVRAAEKLVRQLEDADLSRQWKAMNNFQDAVDRGLGGFISMVILTPS